MTNNKAIGYLGEQTFIELLNLNKIEHEYLDDWCDFKISGVPVDVKTTQLSHKFTNLKIKKQSYKVGRFDLTDKQRELGIWLALYVRHLEQFLFLGMYYANKDSPRYISIHKTRELEMYSLEEFIIIKKKKT